MSIVTVAEIRTFLGLAEEISEAESGRLALLHNLVERSVKRFVRGGVELAEYTHLLPAARHPAATDPLVDLPDERSWLARGTAILPLPELPVRSILSVHEDRAAGGGEEAGDFSAATLLTAGRDYYLDAAREGLSRTGHLVRRGTAWSSRPRTIRVRYTAGWSAEELHGLVPAGELDASDVRLAVLLAVQHWFANSGDAAAGRIRAERLGDYRVEYAAAGLADELPSQCRRLLAPFVRSDL